MRRKTFAKTLTYLALTALVTVAGYLALTLRPGDLDFREIASPAGFRELVTDRQVSPIDQFFAAGRDELAASDVAAPEFDAANVCATLFDDPSSPTAGSEHAKVRLVAFFDYRCPYCRTLTKILSRMQRDGSFRLIYKEWPILGESSVLAARAALAAAKQGQYVAFHMRLMNTGFVPTRSYVEALAGELNLDQAQLLEDMNAPDVTAAIQRSALLASEFGFVGTPALIVGRTVVQGAITRAQLERLVEDEAASGPGGVC